MPRNRGFSLVEILVALSLGGLVVAGIFGMFASQHRILRQQRNIQDSQQELWMSMEYLQRDIRRAGMGFGFCQRQVGSAIYRSVADVWSASGVQQVLRPVLIANGGSGGSDSLTLVYARPASNGASDAVLAAGLDPSSSNSASVLDARGFMQPVGCLCSGTPSCTFAASQFAVLFNPSSTTKPCSIVQVTGATCPTTGNMTLSVNPRIGSTVGGTTPPASPWPAQTYAADERLVNLGATLSVVTYAVDSTASPPVLLRTENGVTQMIAYDVEDLQIVAACDVNQDGTIGAEGTTAATRKNDEWFFNVSGDSTPATCVTFPLVRVTLVGRSERPASGFTAGARPAIEDRSAGTSDGFHRRVTGATVTVPNSSL